VAFSYLFDKTLVEDVLQETFIIAYKDFEKLRQHPNMDGWIVTVIKHTACKLAKRRLPEIGSAAYLDDYGLLELIPFDFPRQDAEILTLYYEKRYGILGIALHLKVSPNVVRVRLCRARARLKALLDKSNEGGVHHG